ncbi:MAG: PBSX family phage terminase large subunit [Gammaproteobacteria bacterium]
MQTRLIRSQVPRAFEPLLAPARYKGAWGGRGSGKSHHFAERLTLRCHERPTRAVCVREVQLSLRDSVRQLLADKIEALGLAGEFEVLDAEIRGKRSGSLITFRGMSAVTAESIKSLEAYDIAWVEEAQTLSERSLMLLRPTIRKEGSEIWASWNPRYRTDPIDEFFRYKPPRGAVSVSVNWRDNPWFPDVLSRELEHDYATDPEQAAHVWGGEYGVEHGAILGRLVESAEREGRINDNVEYFPDGPAVEISSDLGFRDTASWWFWQRRVGGFALLDYDADTGLDAEEWIPRLQKRLEGEGWPLGYIWLPHDARNRTFQSRHTVREQFLEAFGNKVRIVPKTSKTDRINAARTILKRCEFHKTRCEVGLEGLRAWSYEFNPETGIFSKEPAHTAASHPADGYSYGAQMMTEAPAAEAARDERMVCIGPETKTTRPPTWDEFCEAGDKARRGAFDGEV